MGTGSTSAGRVRGDVGDVTGCVVVGTDGSACGRHALRFAAREAQVRGCLLVVVRAWSMATAPPLGGGEPGVVPALSAFEAAVEQHARAEVADVLGADPPCDVVVRPVHDSPGDALVQASRDAALVVVGSRGLGVVAEMLLGSVSAHLVHHAHGPVAVVR
jgi:nucleotide-binding universal stress UspA family protein